MRLTHMFYAAHRSSGLGPNRAEVVQQAGRMLGIEPIVEGEDVVEQPPCKFWGSR